VRGGFLVDAAVHPDGHDRHPMGQRPAGLPFGVQLVLKGEGEAFDLGGVLLGQDDACAGQAMLEGVST
jgi:hypothetical protein